jgi:hypothetical protein
MDYAQLLAEPSPQQLQMMQAEKLRLRQEQAAALQQANAQGSRFDTLAAVAQMANNQGAASAAQMAAKSAQARHKPVNLGMQGFALPESGQFVPSPMYQDEQDERRGQQRQLLAATLAQREQLAAQQAELKRERMADQRRQDQDRNALRLTIAEMGRQGRVKPPADPDIAIDKNVQRYSTTLDKSGLPEVLAALEPVKALLTETKPGQLSGFGRVQGLVPDFMATDNMQGNRTLMQDAANIILKSRSGAAVTSSEAVRFLRAVGSGAGMDEKTLRTGWTNVMSSIAARAASLAAGHGPEVHEEFSRRGGQDLRNLKFAPIPGSVLPKTLGASKPPPAGISPAEWANMTPEERKLF